jgi:hypothetical protein
VRAAVDAHRRAGDDANAGICKRRGIAVREIAALERGFSRADNSNAHALCHAFYVAPDEERQRHVAQTSELRRIVLVVRSEDGPAVIITNINNALRLFGRALFEFFYLSVGEYTAQSPFYLAP